ncbi:MAG: hypothetical protein HZB16_23790 [Armatimonadetes bacterium]|nr:hypothetical protein [Armatimonadota bacterium]
MDEGRQGQPGEPALDDDWLPATARIAQWLRGFDRCAGRLSSHGEREDEVDARVPVVRATRVLPPHPAWWLLCGIAMAVIGVALMYATVDGDRVFEGPGATLIVSGALLASLSLEGSWRRGLARWQQRLVAVRAARRRLNHAVTADPEFLTIEGPHSVECVRWADVMRLDEMISRPVLHLRDGRWLALAGPGSAPLVRVAKAIIAARAEQDEALQARMERGLSRPDDPQHADRGLSLSDDG